MKIFKCLLLIGLFGAGGEALAQKVYRVPNTQRFYVGVKGGLLTSLAAFGDPDLQHEFSPSPMPGFNVAGLVNFSLKNGYSFQSEFGFSQMGRKVSFDAGGNSFVNKTTYRFLDFGMLLRRSFRLKVGKDIPSNWFVNFGPNIKYWMGGKGTLAGAVGSAHEYALIIDGQSKGEYDRLYYNDVNRWLFALDLGVGANVGTLKGQQLMMELRLTYGHTYLGNKDSVTPTSINLLGYNDSLLCNLKVLTLSLAYTLDFYTGQSKMGKSTQKEKKK